MSPLRSIAMRFPSRPSARTSSAIEAGASTLRAVPLTITCMMLAAIASQRLAHEVQLFREPRAHVAQGEVPAQLHALPELERTVLALREQPRGLLARNYMGQGM